MHPFPIQDERYFIELAKQRTPPYASSILPKAISATLKRIMHAFSLTNEKRLKFPLNFSQNIRWFRTWNPRFLEIIYSAQKLHMKSVCFNSMCFLMHAECARWTVNSGYTRAYPRAECNRRPQTCIVSPRRGCIDMGICGCFPIASLLSPFNVFYSKLRTSCEKWKSVFLVYVGACDQRFDLSILSTRGRFKTSHITSLIENGVPLPVGRRAFHVVRRNINLCYAIRLTTLRSAYVPRQLQPQR